MFRDKTVLATCAAGYLKRQQKYRPFCSGGHTSFQIPLVLVDDTKTDFYSPKFKGREVT